MGLYDSVGWYGIFDQWSQYIFHKLRLVFIRTFHLTAILAKILQIIVINAYVVINHFSKLAVYLLFFLWLYFVNQQPNSSFYTLIWPTLSLHTSPYLLYTTAFNRTVMPGRDYGVMSILVVRRRGRPDLAPHWWCLVPLTSGTPGGLVYGRGQALVSLNELDPKDTNLSWGGNWLLWDDVCMHI